MVCNVAATLQLTDLLFARVSANSRESQPIRGLTNGSCTGSNTLVIGPVRILLYCSLQLPEVYKRAPAASSSAAGH